MAIILRPRVDCFHLEERPFGYPSLGRIIISQRPGTHVGAYVWTCSHLMAKFFIGKALSCSLPQSCFQDCSVVELGAGTGHLGIALALMGAHVTVTDMDELVPLLDHNIEMNGLVKQPHPQPSPSAASGKFTRGWAVARALMWGVPPRPCDPLLPPVGSTPPATPLPSPPADASLLPTPQPQQPLPDLGQVDMVVCSDVVYNNVRSHVPLLETLEALLSRPASAQAPDGKPVGYLGAFERYPEQERPFFELLRARFAVVDVPRGEFDPAGAFPLMHLYRFTVP
ncbi:hypothetical protein PAPYR_10571 [Paratrimastix pyriformis]|uniref:Uncharacterized protein n=1 Tax=Paratrimastix pyriformis TaxID=342808 RepID=A0ABQ8UBG6_9EUKA|nr:hypothetical protein PAPYR_10571 [Paratrimastix pyriformis]